MVNPSQIFLEEKDIVMHIAVLMRIAMADGRFLDSEKMFLESVASSYTKAYGTRSFDNMVDDVITNLPVSAIDVWLKATSDRPSQARLLIKDMIALGYVDNDFCKAEREVVDKYAELLNVPKEIVDVFDKCISILVKATNELHEVLEISQVQRKGAR